jgi:hypothetical protein
MAGAPKVCAGSAVDARATDDALDREMQALADLLKELATGPRAARNRRIALRLLSVAPAPGLQAALAPSTSRERVLTEALGSMIALLDVLLRGCGHASSLLCDDCTRHAWGALAAARRAKQ